jgi:uncharacterized hydrophobic protein (TIGR00271 family)
MSTFPLSPTDELGASPEAIRKNIHDNAVFNTAFLIMNALATVVACYGLLEDSAAVVVGAMVIATLLGPITGIALALVDGDNKLLRAALLAEATGAILVLCIALIIGVTHRDAPLTREILSRTTPTLFDLMIALAAGAAGAYASASSRLSAGLVGVAIATALVPPLAVCGICLGRGEVSMGCGALLLFATDLVAIQLASSVVLWLCGLNKSTLRKTWANLYLSKRFELRNSPGPGHTAQSACRPDGDKSPLRIEDAHEIDPGTRSLSWRGAHRPSVSTRHQKNSRNRGNKSQGAAWSGQGGCAGRSVAHPSRRKFGTDCPYGPDTQGDPHRVYRRTISAQRERADRTRTVVQKRHQCRVRYVNRISFLRRAVGIVRRR